jgi:hypothetical protein
MITREIADLAASLRIQAIDLVELHASQPAFDVIPLRRSGAPRLRRRARLRRRPALDRLGNAYDLDTQDWDRGPDARRLHLSARPKRRCHGVPGETGNRSSRAGWL